MSMDIFVLARDGENHGDYDMVCWFDTLEAAEAEAMKREWSDYEANIARGDKHVIYSSPEETEYRRYWVKYVPMG